MRVLLFGIGLLVASASLGMAAQAQNYAWCAQYGNGTGGARNCGFTSFAQCQADVSGIGGFCEMNNTYRPAVGHRHSQMQQ
jgi:hypothetical protein